jgi:radical SAM protein with 4Fe4S-binding SPASM domain
MKMTIYQKINNAEITEKTKLNILRKSDFIDNVEFDANGITPVFSWIDISLTELCNRLCSFCPRSDPRVYPNQNLNFGLEMAAKISDELKCMDYKGGVVFCGYGEPLLHPKLNEILQIFRGIHIEIVTNGDRLTAESVKTLFNSGLSFLCISMYDGEHQIAEFQKMMSEANISSDRFILRDRWHTEKDSFGLKLTNRSGVLDFGPDPKTLEGSACYYPSYSMAIDWNGDVLQCVQDWNKKVKYGNLSSATLMDIWKSIRYHKTRRKLQNGKRTESPCSECNADGCFHGFNHADEWVRITDS